MIMKSEKQNRFKISNQKPETGFQVPDGYFDGFPERMHSRLHSEMSEIPEKSVFRELIIPRLALAASFIGLMVISYTGIRFLVNQQDYHKRVLPIEMADLTEFSVDDLDETALYDLYNETSLADSETVSRESNNKTDEMIEYLLLQGDDIVVLMQEL